MFCVAELWSLGRLGILNIFLIYDFFKFMMDWFIGMLTPHKLSICRYKLKCTQRKNSGRINYKGKNKSILF